MSQLFAATSEMYCMSAKCSYSPKCRHYKQCQIFMEYACVYRAIASGVKGGDDYRGPRLRGGPPAISTTGWGQPKKTLRTVDGPLLYIVTTAYYLRVFQPCQFKHSKKLKAFKQDSEKLNWVLARRVRCVRREPRLTDSKTEPSSPSRHPATKRTNTKSKLKKCKQKKYVKEPNSAPTRGVLCTQRAH